MTIVPHHKASFLLTEIDAFFVINATSLLICDMVGGDQGDALIVKNHHRLLGGR